MTRTTVTRCLDPQCHQPPLVWRARIRCWYGTLSPTPSGDLWQPECTAQADKAGARTGTTLARRHYMYTTPWEASSPTHQQSFRGRPKYTPYPCVAGSTLCSYTLHALVGPAQKFKTLFYILTQCLFCSCESASIWVHIGNSKVLLVCILLNLFLHKFTVLMEIVLKNFFNTLFWDGLTLFFWHFYLNWLMLFLFGKFYSS